MKYKNGREVKLDDMFVHVDSDNNSKHSLAHEHQNRITGHDKIVQSKTFVLDVDEKQISESLHIDDYRKIQEDKKKEAEAKAKAQKSEPTTK